MADEQQVPPTAGDSAERIRGRDHEEQFARLPDHEVHPRTEPGAGPHGGVGTSGTNGPVAVMAIGALVAASVFVFRTPWVLVLGLAIFLGAAIWAGVVGRSQSTLTNPGRSTIERDDGH